MLKVCGVTFDHTTNYGSCLQAYALQTAIERISVCVGGGNTHYDLIPYAAFEDGQDNQMAASFVTRMKRTVLGILHRCRRWRFLEFEKRYMHYADCHSTKDLMRINKSYDAFVCGSDVIWNPDFTMGESIYFLDFVEKYKFSYASSFGVADVDNDYKYPIDRVHALFRENIPRLDAVSVREQSGIRVVYRFTGAAPELVCDPVLLLDKEEWLSIAQNQSTPKGKYIFAYSTYISPNFLTFLKKLERQTGLKVIHVTWDSGEAVRRSIYKFPTPQEWLLLLSHAEFVVTNSFHATAFSVLFHKNFFSVMRDRAVKGTRIRLYGFLDSIGLWGRAYGDTPETIDLSVPNFSFADDMIEKSREKSMAYLHKNLEVAYLRKQEGGKN